MMIFGILMKSLWLSLCVSQICQILRKNMFFFDFGHFNETLMAERMAEPDLLDLMQN